MRSNKRKLTDLGAMLLKTFQFLIDDFDCQLTNQVDEALNCQFEYKNSTTGIVISYEKREQYIRIDLYRLVDGQIVKNITRALKSNEPLNGFSLDYLMKIKDPTKRDTVLPIHKYGEDSEFYLTDGFLKYANKFAFNLKNYAIAILSGNFSEFEFLDKQFREDYYRNIQKDEPAG